MHKSHNGLLLREGGYDFAFVYWSVSSRETHKNCRVSSWMGLLRATAN